MELCSYLLSLMIVGAYETRPGIMYVELLDTNTQTIEEAYVYTEDYLKCWDDGISVRSTGPTDWRRTSTSPYTWLPLYMENKRYKQQRIAKEIEDAVYSYHCYPHMSLVPDWFIRYWDLAEAVCQYFDVPFDKPTLTEPNALEALKVKPLPELLE